MPNLTINSKNIVSQTGSAEPIIASNVIFPAGTVVQVAQSYFNDDGNKSITTSDTLIHADFKVGITPRKTGNRIIIRFEMGYGLDSSHGIGVNIKRTGPSTLDRVKGTGNEAWALNGVSYGAVNWFYRQHDSHSSNYNILFATTYDTAQDVSTEHVYQPFLRANGNQTIKLNRRWSDSLWGGVSNITIMEVMV